MHAHHINAPVSVRNESDTTPHPYTSPVALADQWVQLEILQNAFRSILNSLELREADPPMLDALDALTERFGELLRQ